MMKLKNEVGEWVEYWGNGMEELMIEYFNELFSTSGVLYRTKPLNCYYYIRNYIC